MKDINIPAIAAAINPCATYWNIMGAPRNNPAVGVAMNVAISNPSNNTIFTLFVLNQNPKKMKKNIIPHNRVGVIPVAVYPGKRLGAILSIAKCRAVRFLYAFPNVVVGNGVIVNSVRVCSVASHPVESQDL